MATITEKTTILALLTKFVNSRPGFEWQNYGSAASYRADCKRASDDRKLAHALISWITYQDDITADHIIRELSSGKRLSLVGDRLEYCAGQYYCTEYRAAVCRALVSVIWDNWRNHDRTITGDELRAGFKRTFGARCARLYT